VVGGAVGTIPLDGRVGIGLAAGFAVLAAVRAAIVARGLHTERLHGRPDAAPDPAPPEPAAPEPAAPEPTSPAPVPPEPTLTDLDDAAPRGFHIYRPSSAAHDGGSRRGPSGPTA